MTEDNKGRGGDGVEAELGTCADEKKDKEAERGGRIFFFFLKREKGKAKVEDGNRRKQNWTFLSFVVLGCGCFTLVHVNKSAQTETAGFGYKP